MDVGGVRERLARRAAKEVEEGMVVNLGIGIPTLIADFFLPGDRCTFRLRMAFSATPVPRSGGRRTAISSTPEAFRLRFFRVPPISTVPWLSLIHISEPTRLRRISYAVFCL